jgi:1-acyl-sn-glycerol-3-phosphate acyltransferase
MGDVHRPGRATGRSGDGAPDRDIAFLVGDSRLEIDAFAQVTRRTRWLRLGKLLGGERLLFLAGRLLDHLTIEGEEQIPSTGACLFAFNHVSQPVDLLVNVLIRRRRPDVYFFGLQGMGGKNPLAVLLEGLGERDTAQRLLRVYKARGLSAGELLRAYRILLDGGAISIAPEGEYTWDGRLQHPLAPGAAWLALRSGVPVVPIVSAGGYDLQPRWQLEKIRLTGRVTIHVGQPLYLSEGPMRYLDDQVLATANESLWQAMAALLSAS